MAAKGGFTTRDLFLREFPAALTEEVGAVFVGAGVSMDAGYPSWKSLLREIGEELGINSDDVSDLAALAQWHIRRSASATKIRSIIKTKIGVEYDIPQSLHTISRLPVRHIWTTNYDRLIERAFSEIGRPIDVISSKDDLTLKPKAGATRLYKMHGSIEQPSNVVISTDDYELFRAKRGAFLPLLHAHLSSLSFLFVGISFTDPNIRHVLASIRESFTETPPEHFAIVRPPLRSDSDSDETHQAKLRQHELWADDLRRYGLSAIEVDDYAEVPALLKTVERRLAQQRVWVSGSWPIGKDGDPGKSEFIYSVSHAYGQAIGSAGLTLVNGSGLVVGSAALSGFLSAVQRSGEWALDRRLIVRPFPQPLEGREPDREQWQMLRTELGRIAGIVTFVGGMKVVDGKAVEADGVHKEREIADQNEAFLLPIGATGGAARTIAESLLRDKSLPVSPRRPTDDELKALLDDTKSPSELVSIAAGITKRVSGT